MYTFCRSQFRVTLVCSLLVGTACGTRPGVADGPSDVADASADANTADDAEPQDVSVGDADADVEPDATVDVQPDAPDVTTCLQPAYANLDVVQMDVDVTEGRALVVVDLNDDPYPDLVEVGRTDSGAIELHTGQPDGSFSHSALEFPVSRSWAIVPLITDLNGDGIPDIAAVNLRSVFVFLADPAGEFGEPTHYAFENEHAAGHLWSGDFDGDGFVDLAASPVGSLTDELAVLFSGNGDGTFGGAAPTEELPTNVVASTHADLDGDGVTDHVLLSIDAIYAYLTTPAGVELSDTVQRPGFELDPNPITTDLDGDGNIDLLLHNTRGLHVAYGRGDGTFDEIARVWTSPARINDMCVGDFDGDQELEVAVNSAHTTRIVSVQADREIRASDPVMGTPGDVGCADFDDDGLTDVLLPGVINPIRLRGYGDGTIAGNPAFLGDLVWFHVVEDTNGDGVSDLLTHSSSYGVGSLIGDSESLFRAESNSASEITVDVVLADDFDADGALDLMDMFGDVYLRDTEGVFHIHEREAEFLGPWRPFAGDFDGDGNLDVVSTVARGETRLRFSYGDGTGTLNFVGTEVPVQGLWADVRVGDFDRDGTDDLIYFVGDEASVVLAGADRTAMDMGTLSIGGTGDVDVDVLDFDGDGILDVISLREGALGMHRGRGDGTFDEQVAVDLEPGELHAFRDLNGDDAIDFISFENTSMAVRFSAGGGTFGPAQQTEIGATIRLVDFGDFNGDQIVDVLIAPRHDAWQSVGVVFGACEP